MPWRPKKDQANDQDESSINQNDKKKPRPQDGQEQADDQQQQSGTNEQKLKAEIQQIIRDELKQIIKGEAEPKKQPERKTQVFSKKGMQVVKPIKLTELPCENCAEDEQQQGQQGQQGQGQQQNQKDKQQEPKDPQVKHDIELLTQVQMELSEELASNLKQLKEVIAQSQQLAQRIQAVLGQGQGKQS